MVRLLFVMLMFLMLLPSSAFGDVAIYGSEFTTLLEDCSSMTSEGQACWDTDNDTLYVGTGSSTKAVGGASFEYIYPYTRENPSDADAFLIFKAPEDLTITGIDCIVDPADSGESVVIDVRECDSSGDNCATVDTTITCTNAGASDDGSLSNPSIDSGDWVMIDTGTVTGTVTQLVITIKYTR